MERSLSLAMSSRHPSATSSFDTFIELWHSWCLLELMVAECLKPSLMLCGAFLRRGESTLEFCSPPKSTAFPRRMRALFVVEVWSWQLPSMSESWPRTLPPTWERCSSTSRFLFVVGLLKTGSSGQAFFIQVDRDNFSVPIPYLNKVDTWDNQTMWKLNTQAHCRAIKATPIKGEYRKGTSRRASSPLRKTPPLMQLTIIKRGTSILMLKEVESIK